MRLPGRAFEDPLLRFGAAALAIALLFAAAVAAYALLRENPAEAANGAVKVSAAAASEPLVRSDPGVDPWVEEDVPPPRMEPEPEPQPQPDPQAPPAASYQPEAQAEPAPMQAQEPELQVEPQPQPEPQSEPEPVERASEAPAPQPEPEPEPDPEPRSLPAQEGDWPTPTEEQIESTREPRRYDLPSGAALGLTIGSIGLYDVPVLRSNTQGALDNGVIHARGTSMPWSGTSERNVYLAGHRLGWPGTGSHLVFYRLDELGEGDEISLKSRDGGTYRYEVTESFVVDPGEVWVMGRVRGRDMLTLQTCTPIPGFQERLIVRAERV